MVYKDFVNEIINTENKIASNTSNDEFLKVNKELLFDPTIFIRKWIGEVIFSNINNLIILFVQYLNLIK